MLYSTISEDNKANVIIEDLGDYDDLFLVVSSQPRDTIENETFRYQARAFGTPSFEGGSCSVSSSNTGALWLFLAVLELMVARRQALRITRP